MAAAAAKAAKRRRRRAASRAMQRAGPRPTPTCRRRALPCVLSGASTTVLCNTTALTNGGNNTYICQNIASVNVSALGLAGLTATSTAVPSGGTTAGTASGNIDPLYGQTWSGTITTANAGYKTPAFLSTGGVTLVDLNGSSVAPQTGWGGGPNVALGPQTPASGAGNVVWGVHSTPFTAGSSSPATVAAMRVSWYLGDNTLNSPAAAGAAVATPSPAAFVPANTAFTATIAYSTTGAARQVATFGATNLTCLQYFRTYTNATGLTGLTYTSPYICHATLSGLVPNAKYNFTISATVSSNGAAAVAYITPAATVASSGPANYYFTTAPPPSASGSPSAGYPYNWVLMADVGQTYNSSLTAQYVTTYAKAKANGVGLILNVADLAYADNYCAGSNNLPSASCLGSGTNQQRWDSMFTMWQPARPP